MISKIGAYMPFKARKEISKDKLEKTIKDQLPAQGKWIASAVEVTDEGSMDYLEITQGDNIAKFVSRFVDGKIFCQEESYNGNKPTFWTFDENGNRIKQEEPKTEEPAQEQ